MSNQNESDISVSYLTFLKIEIFDYSIYKNDLHQEYSFVGFNNKIPSKIKEALMEEFKNILYPVALTDISPQMGPPWVKYQ